RCERPTRRSRGSSRSAPRISAWRKCTHMASSVASRTSTVGATMREAILAGIGEEMERDEAVVVVGQDVRAFEGPLKCTEGLWERFGDDRVIEMAICESSM